jgi:xylulokinase
MISQYILKVDVGTSSTKTSLWDQKGVTIAKVSAANIVNRPSPLQAEIDGNQWWQTVVQTIRQVVSESGISPDDIAGIGIDGIGWALVPVDQNVNPLAPVMIWQDRRSSDEAAWLNSLPESAYLIDLVANPIDEAYIAPKMVWLRKNQPEIFDSTYRFLGATGFIVARLTGEFTCDHTQGYGYHFFDIRNKRWNEKAAKVIGVPLEKMPRLCPPTEVVGAVTARAAAETGLRAGIPVIAGCVDAAAGALGAGVTRPGQINEQGGQAGGFGISLNQVIVEPRLILSNHIIPGQYLLAAGTVGGGSLGWFRDQLGQMETTVASLTQQTPFDLFSLQAGQSPAGANGLIFLPYMAGERSPLWSSVARGVFFGLSYNSSRADILRAMMEGCAFAVYHNLNIAEEHGVDVTEFLGSGGATNSQVWCQTKADVYGRPFVVARRTDGSNGGHSLGLFAMTACAVGLYTDITECVNFLLPKRQLYEPSPRNHEIYEELFQVYLSVSRKLMGDFADLDRIKRTIL